MARLIAKLLFFIPATCVLNLTGPSHAAVHEADVVI
jgi:hypothetical protein